MSTQVGYSSNGIPYARLSTTGPALVVLTGSEMEHKPPSWMARQGYLVGMKRLVSQYSLYLTSRKPNLPVGYTAQDMSEDLAEMIRADIGGPVHLMGISSGGSSVMHLAADHPDLVNKLVLAMTAYRLNPHGREVCEAWRDLARAGQWPALWERMGVDATEGGTPEWIIRPLMRWFGRWILGTPKSGSDLAVVLEADIHLDVRAKLPMITAPTLVIGGAADPFYGSEAIRETAQLIPNAVLHLMAGGGHAVVKSHTRAFEERILTFLQEGPH